MTSPVFGPAYADAYDLFYREKDYAAECDLIERALQEYGRGEIDSILDLGCGTGGHSIPLAERGYSITGVDRSAEMLSRAQHKASSSPASGRLAFLQGDVSEVRVDQQFDAALLMFAVLGYQIENSAVLGTLRSARAALRPGGLLVFDVWYGPAVLQQRPSDRLSTFDLPDGHVIRAVFPELDTARHVCTVRYQLWKIEGGRLVDQSVEAHQMRYFFPMELALFLETCGFQLRRLAAFPHLDHDPDESTWNALGVAQAV